MNKDQISGPEPPFHVAGFEKDFGPVEQIKILGPGVCYVLAHTSKLFPGLVSEYIVVVGDTPVVSPEARAYGTPLSDDPHTLVYKCEEYFSKERWVIQYELHKYFLGHNIPLPEDGSLAEDKARGMEVCPEYFGEFTPPTETPWGQSIQYEKITNGLFWLKTAQEGWVLAVAYPLCDDLSKMANDFAVLTKYDQEQGIDNTCGFRFFTYGTSCVPLFELLNVEDNIPWREKIHEAALKNAILQVAPDYAQWNNSFVPYVPREDKLIVQSPDVGTDFFQFPSH